MKNIEEGIHFKHRNENFYVVVNEVIVECNIVKVTIHKTNGHQWDEDWNLEHTYSGFSDGTYISLDPFRIRKRGDILLEMVAHEVKENENMKPLIAGMFSAMYVNKGIGLSANQVGILKRVIIVDVRGFKQVLIKPHNNKRKRHSQK